MCRYGTRRGHVNDSLTEPEWRQRQEAHHERVRPWITPRLERRKAGRKHPVDDFLFDYYHWRPAQLARWHPGAGVRLTGNVREWGQVRGYIVSSDVASADTGAAEPGIVDHTLDLLTATASRSPGLGCFGRHEWAMVYGLSAEQVRHSSWSLRVSPAEVAEVVESSPLRCTHFDAYRFFTPGAHPRNMHTLTRASQVEYEQPGCLHASMDLYKWAYRCYPIVSAELTADCFELARDARELDMRAAPYDLIDLGFEPIAIESAEGRAEYLAMQRSIFERAADLRQRLIHVLQASAVAVT